MKVALYCRILEDINTPHLLDLLAELQLHKIKVLAHENIINNTHISLSKKSDLERFRVAEELDKDTDCMISLGGDGTMLDAAVLIRESGIPLLGINFGRLGFLASFGKQQIKALVDALVNGQFLVDQRSLVHLDSDRSLFSNAPFALNEFVLHKRDTSSMVKIHTYLNGEFLNTYWADGLIVSTPTGSTGYNLSCNGPILFPTTQSFVLTPIAPHHLNVRPIVIDDNNVVSFEVEGRSDSFICSLDARREIVDMRVQLAIRKESFTIGLLRLTENTFLETLRNKLTWGLDKRN